MIKQAVEGISSLHENKHDLIVYFRRLHEQGGSVQPPNFLHFLNTIKVSEISIFADSEWNLNLDNPHAARAVEGSKLSIDFNQYSYIPMYVMIELKCITKILLMNSSIIRDRKKDSKQQLKANTVLGEIKVGLSYLNAVFESLQKKYGAEFIISNTKSLSEVAESDFRDTAETYQQTYSSALRNFFFDLQSRFVSEHIIGDRIKADFESFQWMVVPLRGNSKKQVISDYMFERLSLHSSSLIVEFLECMGFDIKDKASLKYKADRFRTMGLSNDVLVVYRAIRLREKGFTQEDVEQLTELPCWAYGADSQLLENRNLRERYKERISCSGDDVRRYVNELSYASIFIVAQFTGMRPSELSEVIVENGASLSEDQGFTVIKSEVKKKRNAQGIFDDLWIAIPIIQDAITVSDFISSIKNNPFLASNADTVRKGAKAKSMMSVKTSMLNYLNMIFEQHELDGFSFNPYMIRHTLAYQLFKADVGLPFISHQLKHVVHGVERYSSSGSRSDSVLGYGEIAEKLVKGERNSISASLRHRAELEGVISLMDPDGIYLGERGAEHKRMLQRTFTGYIEAGYTKDEVLESMAKQGLGIINVGTGFCYGGELEDFDESLPCIGSLRCNPLRCSNAIVTQANASKWKEVYYLNRSNLSNPDYQDNKDGIRAAMEEAAGVLKHLGVGLIL